MRMPNGYGSVYKLSGNRRKPWVAAKTDGYVEVEGKNPKRKYHIIGYFQTRAAAMQALAEFNDNPYDIELSKVTFSEIYEKWFKEKFDDASNSSTVRNYQNAFRKSEELHGMIMADIRPHHMQKVIDEASGGYASKNRIQTLFKQIYKWCIDHDCIKKNYAELTKINAPSNDGKARQRFSSEEVKLILKTAENNENADLIEVLLFTGVRVMELFDLKEEDVDFESQSFFVKQSKTAAGIRIVPIADKLLPIFKKYYDKTKCDYVFCNKQGEKMSYDNFKRRYWQPLMSELKIEHTIHETRHTFISMASAKNLNPTLIKKIVGHKSLMSLTERIYTHPEIKEMVDAVNLIAMC